mmetsp:Transcript_40414/g.93790  ORF Transcript_40414/g.93790 Transcript_40414/m.93790 type:complete len:279 (-) Transcript_40414:554-1390(-)
MPPHTTKDPSSFTAAKLYILVEKEGILMTPLCSLSATLVESPPYISTPQVTTLPSALRAAKDAMPVETDTTSLCNCLESSGSRCAPSSAQPHVTTLPPSFRATKTSSEPTTERTPEDSSSSTERQGGLSSLSPVGHTANSPPRSGSPQQTTSPDSFRAQKAHPPGVMLFTPLCNFSAAAPIIVPPSSSRRPQVTTAPVDVSATNAPRVSPQEPTTETTSFKLPPSTALLSPPNSASPQVRTSPVSFRAANACMVCATDTTPLRSWVLTSSGGAPPASG